MRTIADAAEFDGLIRSSPKPVLVDFFATWCGPCVRIAPVLDALAKEHPQVEFVKVDVDEAQELAQAQGIRAMPTFKMFKGGAEVGMVRGADDHEGEYGVSFEDGDFLWMNFDPPSERWEWVSQGVDCHGAINSAA